MSKKILIDGSFPNQHRVALVNSQNKLEDLEYESSSIKPIKGNIYLAKISRIEPGLQAAFIDYGSGKNGFLPFSEIHPGYYHIPVADVQKINEKFSNLEKINPPETDFDDEHYQPDSDVKNNFDEDIDLEQLEKFVDEETNSELVIDNEANDLELDENNDEDEIPLYKQYKIQEVIKRGQIILVQAQKEERGNKGASFTSYISLAGKYSVLMPNNPKHHGISRKISHHKERNRLKNIISSLVGGDDQKFASIIVRTAGMGKSASEIKRDYEYLVNLWNHIREETLNSKAPSLIHVEEGIIQKTIRDMYDHKVNEIVVDGQEAYNSAIEFMKHILPNDVNKIKKHENLVPLFSAEDIEQQVSSLYQQSVNLPSGGYIVINPTEALTAIDVNSGKSILEKNIEETALKTNVEAAKEVARQMKLRDISGLVVIDFIDMYHLKHKKIVERLIKEYATRDKAKIQIGYISSFGLLELSRQRMRPSFLESHTKMCESCNGKGIIRDEEANSMLILRTIEDEIHKLDSDIVNIYAHSSTVLYILNNKRIEIAIVEEKYGVKLNFYIDSSASSDSFSIEKVSCPAFEEVLQNYDDESLDLDNTESDKENINSDKHVEQLDSKEINKDKSYSSKQKNKNNKQQTKQKTNTKNKENKSGKEKDVVSNSNLDDKNKSKQEDKETPSENKNNLGKKTTKKQDSKAKVKNNEKSSSSEKNSIEKIDKSNKVEETSPKSKDDNNAKTNTKRRRIVRKKSDNSEGSKDKA